VLTISLCINFGILNCFWLEKWKIWNIRAIWFDNSGLAGYASVPPFLYFDPPTLLRPKLYFDLYVSTNKKSRKVEVERSKYRKGRTDACRQYYLKEGLAAPNRNRKNCKSFYTQDGFLMSSCQYKADLNYFFLILF